jgi:hypothetical protein
MTEATSTPGPASAVPQEATAGQHPTDREDDLALLRRYEPIVHYTKGELFFPTAVDSYVARSSLWVHRPSTGRNELLVPAGQLSVANLAEPHSTEFGAVEFLRRVEDVDLATQARALLAGSAQDLPESERFHRGAGRLARVGYVSRLIDAVFSLSLLVRGHTPGAVVAASARAYREALAEDERYVYYGRVVRGGGWVALQYRYFFYFNDYRSTFDGVDDHEADWEMALVYLSAGPDGELEPDWVAYACHDFSGDDLRRRWDDSEGLLRVGDHPVIFAGGGSHASYFKPGEYILQIELPITKSLRRIGAALSRFWSGTLRQASSGRGSLSVFTVPFVDYARGDGLAIGPGQAKEWTAVNLDPVPEWITRYRGLWGLYTGDQLGGEDAPAGPMYNRDGTVRQAWYDPFGFAGLDKVAPPSAAHSLLERRRGDLVASNEALAVEIDGKTEDLRLQNEELAALEGNPYVEREYDEVSAQIKALGTDVRKLHRAYAENTASLEAIDLRIQRLREGATDDPKAHIRHANEPTVSREARFGRAAEIWAGISIGLVLIALVSVFLLAPAEFLPTAALLIGLTLFIDALFRGVAEQFVNSLAVVLAVAAAAILLGTFWPLMLLGLLLVIGVYLTWENIRAVRE